MGGSSFDTDKLIGSEVDSVQVVVVIWIVYLKRMVMVIYNRTTTSGLSVFYEYDGNNDIIPRQ